MHVLTLRHATTGETRDVPVLGADRGLRLRVKWELAGIYVVSLKARAMLRSPRGAPTLWRIADVEAAWHVWRDLCAPSVDPPRILGMPLRAEPWRPAWHPRAATKKRPA